MTRAAREAASRARQQQHRAKPVPQPAPRGSWWLCPPGEFYATAHAQEPRQNAVAVAYATTQEARKL